MQMNDKSVTIDFPLRGEWIAQALRQNRSRAMGLNNWGRNMLLIFSRLIGKGEVSLSLKPIVGVIFASECH